MELLVLEEALASCALDDNPFAKELMKLKRKDRFEYYKRLFKLQEESEEFEKEIDNG